MSTPEERLAEYGRPWTESESYSNYRNPPTRDDVNAVLDELKAARAKLADAEAARRSLQARIVASAHLLDKPFTDRPELSPWELLKHDLARLRGALS